MAELGWIGEEEQLLYVLGLAGADRDEAGKFLVYGEPPIKGLTGEVVIPAGCEYSVQGKRANLVGLLSATSYGTKVTVI